MLAQDGACLMVEVWRDVVGYEGLYAVSSLGRIKRTGKARGAVVGRILSDRATRNGGYIVNGLWKDEKMSLLAVHRIVAEAFLGPAPSERHIVAHNDGNPKNNVVSNLRWTTLAENTYDQVLHGTNIGKFYGRKGALTDTQILSIRADHRSAAAIAPEYGMSPGAVHQIRKRKTHTHLAPAQGILLVVRQLWILTTMRSGLSGETLEALGKSPRTTGLVRLQ